MTPARCASSSRRQGGAALLVGLLLLMTALTAVLVAQFSAQRGAARKEAQTAAALAAAKEGLIGFAVSVDLAITPCGVSCKRPGELPCPDNHALGSGQEGVASGPCSGTVIGRLPWRTLGLPDLRDADGERLLYVVSRAFRNNPRVLPLNSDTAGTLTVRSSDGSIIHQGGTATGAAAVIIAPGAALLRKDGVVQSRSNANYLVWNQYLDCWGSSACNVEDNANFTEAAGSTNGFIMGPIRDASGNVVVNDRVAVLSRQELMQAAGRRVVAEVRQGINTFYATNGYFPTPAAFGDTGCLGNAALTGCSGSGGIHAGRLPANPGANALATSPWRAAANGNWFQQNGWRESIYYTVTPACMTGPCASGVLTLNDPGGAAASGQRAVIIAAGPAVAAQVRATNANKTSVANYLEDENLLPLDDVYTRRPALSATTFNDYAVSIP